MSATKTLQTLATVSALAGGALDDFAKIARPIGDDIMRHYSPVWRWVGGKCVKFYRCKHTGRLFDNRGAVMDEHFVWGALEEIEAADGGSK